METWDFIRDQGLNYHLGCAIKYICRAGFKDSKADDLKKAIHYLENELQNTLPDPEPNGYGRRVPGSILPEYDSNDYSEIFDR